MNHPSTFPYKQLKQTTHTEELLLYNKNVIKTDHKVKPDVREPPFFITLLFALLISKQYFSIFLEL